MSGIIELWRREHVASMPVRFTVGGPPMLPNGTFVEDSPPVRSIVYRESGSVAGKRMLVNGCLRPHWCISFEESHIQRFIPADEVVELAYETKQSDDGPSTPELED